MRTFAPALLVLAVPSVAQAAFAPEPIPPASHRSEPIVARTSERDRHVERELDRVRDDIGRQYDNGRLSRREARQLRKETRRIAAMADRFGSDGLSELERRELELRTSELRNRTATGRAS